MRTVMATMADAERRRDPEQAQIPTTWTYKKHDEKVLSALLAPLIPVNLPTGPAESGERALIGALLEDAIRTAEQHHWGTDGKKAQWWLFDDPESHEVFGAEWICQHLDMDYTQLANALQARLAQRGRLWPKEARLASAHQETRSMRRFKTGFCRACNGPARARTSVWCDPCLNERKELRAQSRELYYRRQSLR